jgi:hypothetical protein
MIKIVTDSNADLSPAQAEQFGVSGMGYSYVNFGDKSYRTQLDLGNEQFQQMLKSNPAFPKTSAPSVGDYVDVYEKLKGEEVISIHISRDLSGTIGSAETAAGMMGNDPRIAIVDTRMVNAGQSLFVAEARRLIDAGKSLDEIKSHLEAKTSRCKMHIRHARKSQTRRARRQRAGVYRWPAADEADPDDQERQDRTARARAHDEQGAGSAQRDHRVRSERRGRPIADDHARGRASRRRSIRR